MIESIQFAKYVEPNYEEKATPQGFVQYGDDNLYPQYLIDLYNSSAVHHALVDSIAYMIFGKGIESEGEAKLQIEKWGLNDEIRKACLDLKLQGGFALEIMWSIDRTKISKVSHVPFEQIRSGVANVDGEVPFYYHCLNWENWRKAGYTEIKSFDPEHKVEHPHQLMYIKPFAVGSMYYPKPDYQGSINWIECDKQIAIYHNANLRNGMSPSFAIHFKNGIPPKEKRSEIRRDIENQMTSPYNAGKFFMTFSDGGDTAPDFTPFALSDAHNQYQYLSDESTNKIMIGHRVTSPALFGVKTEGQLGGATELAESAQLFNANVIVPYQQMILDTIHTMLRESGIYGRVTIQAANPLFDSETPSIEQSFTGIQISSALEIISQVKSGVLNTEQGIQLLVQMLNFPEAAAQKIFGVEPLEMSSHELTEELEAQLLEYLESVGERIGDEWELISEQEVEDEKNEYKIHLEKQKFFKRFADPDAKSSNDTGLYKIRYRYSQNLKDNSRLFCRNMVSNSKGGVVYRFEDIQSMDGQVNTEFSPKGSNSYSIWEWKGGVYCGHRWVRQVYFRKRENGKFLPNKGLANDTRIPESQAIKADVPMKDEGKNWAQASTAPINTPSRGKLN
jgi:hypothetical protein